MRRLDQLVVKLLLVLDPELAEIADIIHVHPRVLGAQLLHALQPGQSPEDKHVSDAHEAVDVVERCRALVEDLLYMAEDVVPTEVLVAGVGGGPEELGAHTQVDESELQGVVAAKPGADVLGLQVSVRVAELVYFLETREYLPQHRDHEGHFLLVVRDLHRPRLQALAPVRHQYFPKRVTDFVAQQRRQAVMDRALLQHHAEVLAEFIVLLVFYVGEDLQLPEDALELLHLVLLEDDPGLHDLVPAEEDHSLARAG